MKNTNVILFLFSEILEIPAAASWACLCIHDNELTLEVVLVSPEHIWLVLQLWPVWCSPSQPPSLLRLLGEPAITTAVPRMPAQKSSLPPSLQHGLLLTNILFFIYNFKTSFLENCVKPVVALSRLCYSIDACPETDSNTALCYPSPRQQQYILLTCIWSLYWWLYLLLWYNSIWREQGQKWTKC